MQPQPGFGFFVEGGKVVKKPQVRTNTGGSLQAVAAFETLLSNCCHAGAPCCHQRPRGTWGKHVCRPREVSLKQSGQGGQGAAAAASASPQTPISLLQFPPERWIPCPAPRSWRDTSIGEYTKIDNAVQVPWDPCRPQNGACSLHFGRNRLMRRLAL